MQKERRERERERELGSKKKRALDFSQLKIHNDSNRSIFYSNIKLLQNFNVFFQDEMSQISLLGFRTLEILVKTIKRKVIII